MSLSFNHPGNQFSTYYAKREFICNPQMLLGGSSGVRQVSGADMDSLIENIKINATSAGTRTLADGSIAEIYTSSTNPNVTITIRQTSLTGKTQGGVNGKTIDVNYGDCSKVAKIHIR
jgi:hypothetical protein